MKRGRAALGGLLAAAGLMIGAVSAQTAPPSAVTRLSTNAAEAYAPVGPGPAAEASGSGPRTAAGRATAASGGARPATEAATPAADGAGSAGQRPRELSAFEQLATLANGGQPVYRLGHEPGAALGALPRADTPARVPPDYRVQVGDEIAITAWGSVEGHWAVRVDRAGRIALPRVGPVAVAGLSAAELQPALKRRLDAVFRGHEVAAAITELSPIRVHVTGFVRQRGDQVLPGLSTVSDAIAHSLGPLLAGSLRQIQVLREGQPVATFDAYALMRGGRRQQDVLLQSGDLLYVEPSGPQAAVVGSVKQPAVLEFRPGETVGDALRLAGGFDPVADPSVLVLQRMSDRLGVGARELQLPRDAGQLLQDGDVLVARSRLGADGPSQTRFKQVRVSGEVLRPGDYLLPPTATLRDAVQAAGGATPSAFLFGTALRRHSVRQQQELNYERALRELESELYSATGQRPGAEQQTATEVQAIQQLLARLRERRPEGRVVLEVTPGQTELPALALEDGDQIHLPPDTLGVGVFGSVYNAGSFVHQPGRSLGDYLRRAGGPRETALQRAAFVVRASGEVLSATQERDRWRLRSFEQEPALPGDTVFVPEEVLRQTWLQGAKDWTQVLYQLGVGLAALLTIR